MDLEHNSITTSEEIPSVPEPEYSTLRGEIMKLLYPNVVGIDQMKSSMGNATEQNLRGGSRPWGEDHDLQLRLSLWKIKISLTTHSFLGLTADLMSEAPIILSF